MHDIASLATYRMHPDPRGWLVLSSDSGLTLIYAACHVLLYWTPVKTSFKFELVNDSLIAKTLQGLKASNASGLDIYLRIW